MNVLKGTIKEVKVNEALSIVKVSVGDYLFSAIVIDTPITAPYLNVDNKVKVIFKETEVIIGKGKVDNISLQNKVEGEIVLIESDKLLSKLVIATPIGKITSIITCNAVNQLELKVGVVVTAMIKTNELMLSK